MAHFNSHGQLVYYVFVSYPASTSSTSTGQFVQDPTCSVGFHYSTIIQTTTDNSIDHLVQQPQQYQHNVLVSPPAAAASMPNISYHAAAGGRLVADVPPPSMVYPYPPQEHLPNQPPHVLVQNHPPENNSYYVHPQHQQHDGSKATSRKRNFDDYQQFSSSSTNSHHHGNPKMANNRHKQTADNSRSGATDDGTCQNEGPTDLAMKKRILLANLEEEKPRRPLTAYNFFFSEERERIIAEISCKTSTSSNEDDTSTMDSSSLPPPASPVSVQEGDTHGNSDDKELQGGSAEDGTAYDNDLLEEKIRAKTEKLLSSRRQCDRPKRSHKKEHGKVSFQVLCSLVGKRWKALTAEQKQYYADLSKRDIERYREDMKEYARKRARVVEDCASAVDDASNEG
jgi:hypothetical protein